MRKFFYYSCNFSVSRQKKKSWVEILKEVLEVSPLELGTGAGWPWSLMAGLGGTEPAVPPMLARLRTWADPTRPRRLREGLFPSPSPHDLSTSEWSRGR